MKKNTKIRILLDKQALENPFFKQIHLSKEMRALHRRIRKEMIKYNIQGTSGVQIHIFEKNGNSY